MFLSRRQFLKVSAGTVAAVAVADKVLAFFYHLSRVYTADNPLWPALKQQQCESANERAASSWPRNS